MIPQIVAVVNKLLVTRRDQDRAALRSYGAIRETARLEKIRSFQQRPAG